MYQRRAPPVTSHPNVWVGTSSFSFLGRKEEHAGDVQHWLLYFNFLFHVMPLYISWDQRVISHKLWLMIPLNAVCCAPLENQTILQAKAAYTKYDVFAKKCAFPSLKLPVITYPGNCLMFTFSSIRLLVFSIIFFIFSLSCFIFCGHKLNYIMLQKE